MLKSVKKRLIHHILVLVFGLAFVIVGLVTNIQFNNKNYNVIYNTSDKTSSEKINFGISYGEHWTSSATIDGVSKNVYARTYDLNVKNNNKYTVDSYTIKITPNKTFYLTACWNGSIEIHQGKTVEYITDLRTYDLSKSKLNTSSNSTDRFIVMTSNDYLIYYPSKSSLETPLEKNQSTNIGMIIYMTDSSIPKMDVYMSYNLDRNIFLSPMFDVGLSIIVIICLFAGFEILLSFRIKSLVRQKEHDEKMILESIETFIGFIDAKDPYTNGHSIRVALYTKMLAQELGFSQEEINNIYYIALLHDCGKIGISDNILCKPAKLTDEEYAIIKKHPELGAEILKNFTSIEGVQNGVLYHHERYDGKGYPQGLAGEDIPIVARIICVADSVDAMYSDRCYRKKLSREKILEELVKNKGTQFDPLVCDKMIDLIESNKINIK